MTEETWGSVDRYYAAASERSRKGRLTRLEADLGSLLKKRYPDLPETVERAFKDSNALIREHLRTETGLRLSSEKERRSVPVRIVEGLPEPLRRKLRFDPKIFELYFDLKFFQQAEHGLGKLLKHDTILRHWPQIRDEVPARDEIETCKGFLSRLVALLQKESPFEVIWGINEDLLGAYFFQQSRIELYWMPIGLAAADLGISPEALTQVIAIHELAHAYTHLGFDIDDLTWSTDVFAETDISIVEGIAQFYTGAVCRGLKKKMPDTHEAYRQLLTKQSGPYKVHLEWVSQDEAGGEAVRFALLQCRRHNIADYGKFHDLVEEHKKNMGRKKRGEKSPRWFG